MNCLSQFKNHPRYLNLKRLLIVCIEHTKTCHCNNMSYDCHVQILMAFLHVISCTLIGNLSKLWMTIATLKFPRSYSIAPLLQTFPPLSQTFPPLSQTFPPLLQTFPHSCSYFPHCRRHSQEIKVILYTMLLHNVYVLNHKI